MLCELEAGLRHTDLKIASQNVLNAVLGKIRLWPMGTDAAEQYGAVYAECRKKDRVLSQVDMMLAAMARLLNRPILTADHFAALPDLRTENWIGNNPFF